MTVSSQFVNMSFSLFTSALVVEKYSYGTNQLKVKHNTCGKRVSPRKIRVFALGP